MGVPAPLPLSRCPDGPRGDARQLIGPKKGSFPTPLGNGGMFLGSQGLLLGVGPGLEAPHGEWGCAVPGEGEIGEKENKGKGK